MQLLSARESPYPSSPIASPLGDSLRDSLADIVHHHSIGRFERRCGGGLVLEGMEEGDRSADQIRRLCIHRSHLPFPLSCTQDLFMQSQVHLIACMSSAGNSEICSTTHKKSDARDNVVFLKREEFEEGKGV
jgi:hypothetical protein